MMDADDSGTTIHGSSVTLFTKGGAPRRIFPPDFHYLLLLIAAGALANRFFNVDLCTGFQFLPGTIAAVMAARIFGGLWGGISAIPIYITALSYLGHPIFMLPLVGEAVCLGLLATFRRSRNIVLYDLLYWPLVGAPLVFYLHNAVAPVSYEGIFISTLTFWLNGISSAFVVSIFVTYWPLLFRRHDRTVSVSVRNLVFDLFVGMVLIPSNIILSLNDRDSELNRRNEAVSHIEESGRGVYYETRLQLENRLLQLSGFNELTGASLDNRKKREFVRITAPEFRSIALYGLQGEKIALFPEGHNDFIHEESGRKKVLTGADAFVSDLGTLPSTGVNVVILGVPLKDHSKTEGSAFGLLDAESFRKHLVTSIHKSFHKVFLLDGSGKIIASTDPDRSSGSVYASSRILVETPTGKKSVKLAVPGDMSHLPLWMREGLAVYRFRTPLDNSSRWSVALEAPFAPYQEKLFAEHRKSLIYLMTINVFSIMLGLFVSSRISGTLGLLSRMSSDLPGKLVAKEGLPEWPGSRVTEIRSLIDNFKVMSDALYDRFREIEENKDLLEQRIDERTRELAAKNLELQKEATERKRTELQRDHLMDELVNHLKFLQTLIDAIPNPIYYKDEQGCYLGCNIAYEKCMGLSRENILGKTSFDLFPPQMASVFVNADRDLLNSRSVQVFESEIMFSEGKLSTVLFCKAVFERPDGAVGGIVGSIIDISERKKAEMDRDRLMVELKVKNKELEEVIYVASHDLRSPLVNVQGFSRKLSKVTGELEALVAAIEMPESDRKVCASILGESIPKSIRFITSSVEKMDALLSGLLRLSRLGRAAMCVDTVDMDTLFQQIISAMKFQLESAGVSISVDSLPACQGDLVQINQLFTNLIDNAVKYRSPDRPLSIRVHGESFEKAVRYCVDDNGLGIPKEQQEKIWDIFHRLNPSDTQGEGLGLTIVRRIVNRHGGAVWVESEHGEGSSFFVILPKPGHILTDTL